MKEKEKEIKNGTFRIIHHDCHGWEFTNIFIYKNKNWYTLKADSDNNIHFYILTDDQTDDQPKFHTIYTSLSYLNEDIKSAKNGTLYKKSNGKSEAAEFTIESILND